MLPSAVTLETAGHVARFTHECSSRVSCEAPPFLTWYAVIAMPTRTRIVDRQFQRTSNYEDLLDQAKLPDEIELRVEPGRLIVQAARRPRAGWAAAAKRMRARGDDRLLAEQTSTKFDRRGWEWQ